MAVDDRIRIGRAFHRQAGEYDRNASVQKRVVKRLEQIVSEHQARPPLHALDIGCGTGAMLSVLREKYPDTQLCGLDLAFNMAKFSEQSLAGKALVVNGAAEQLPFRNGAFDLVVSASTLQWVERLDVCFEECHRVLRGEGLLCTAFFGGRTLWELHQSYREAVASNFGADDLRNNRLHRFRETDEVIEVLSRYGYKQLLIFKETEMEYYGDVSGVLRSIKSIGATTTARNESSGGLGGRGMLKDMEHIYNSRYKKDELIPVTYEVIYIVARRIAG